MMGNVVHVQYSGECDGRMSEGEPGIILTSNDAENSAINYILK